MTYVPSDWMDQDELFMRVSQTVLSPTRVKKKVLLILQQGRIRTQAEDLWEITPGGRWRKARTNVELYSYFWPGVQEEFWNTEEDSALRKRVGDEFYDLQAECITFSRGDVDLIWPSGSEKAAQTSRSHLDSEEVQEIGPGRPLGGPYEAFDRDLFLEIDALLAAGKAQSANSAALLLADRIVGQGEVESRVRRLSRLYNKERKRPS